METVVQVAQLLLALSILVGIHEAGHMISARIFGMRVEKFFIGFPPRIFSFKKGDTEYGLGAVPLGGFVKISGMIDESLDKDQMNAEPQPWEFRSKPAWQRLIVMLGGVFVNVVAGVIAMIILTYNVGDEYWPSEVVKTHGIQAMEYGEEIGFQTGDKVLDINGEDYERFRDLTDPDLFLSSDSYYTVDRGGERVRIDIPESLLRTLSKDRDFRNKFVIMRSPFQVSYREVEEGSAAMLAGILEGDRITRIGNDDIEYFDEFRTAIGQYAGDSVAIDLLRDNQALTVTALVNADSTIGFRAGAVLERSRKDYTFSQAVSKGTGDAFGLVITNARAMGKMFTGGLSPRSLSGPLGIVEMFPKTWDWNAFWFTTAFISMILAFMNLLPIPALDGGHVVFLLFEMISGKAPSDAFLENAQKVGMVILLALMVFVFGNDILKFFGI